MVFTSTAGPARRRQMIYRSVACESLQWTNVMFILTSLHMSMTTSIKCHGALRNTDRILAGRDPALSYVWSKFVTAFTVPYTKPQESKSHPQSSCHLDEFLCYTIIYSLFLRVAISLTKQIEKSSWLPCISNIQHLFTSFFLRCGIPVVC